METPDREIVLVPAKTGEQFTLQGGLTLRVMEDGSKTDNRIGAVELTIPANTKGPPPHWHEMHDETFLVTQGTVRFHAKDGKHVDAKTGDYIVVPTKAAHTFSNPTDEEARFFNTFTPAHYVNYFRLMNKWSLEGQKMDPEKVKKAMAYFATVGVDGPL
ncbi:hypothetical protein LTR95_012223 [Oleoguttula sp. CCFEE 5521]